MRRGKLIVIDGPDYVGKKTQTDFLYRSLKAEGLKVKTIRFPFYETPTGRIVGQCLLGKKREWYQGDVAWFGDPERIPPEVASHFYAADRKMHSPWMNQMLDSGTHLISDRYYQANMGHQGAKIKDRLDRQWFFQYIKDLELGLNKIPREDLCILLTLPIEIAMKLASERVEEADRIENNWDHLRAARECYGHMWDHFSRHQNWYRVECSWDGEMRPREEINEEIRDLVRKELRI
ncbi:MAG: hypothetical protein ABIB79_02100 [archaeon]